MKPLSRRFSDENPSQSLQVLLLTGRGYLLGAYIRNHFPHARVVEEPVFANALGFWRFCQRLANRVGVNNG